MNGLLGTVAMFLVGGAFITEGIEPMQHFIEKLVEEDHHYFW
jgi:predicted DNA repair protein MutK